MDDIVAAVGDPDRGRRGGLTDRVSVRLACATGDSDSIAVTVKVTEPAVVGVPEIAPAGESASPSGSLPDVTDQVSGPIPARVLSVAAYRAPTVARGSVCGGIASGP